MTTITPLPAPPSRSDPANFSDRADAFLGALPLFALQANALAEEVGDLAQTAILAPGTTATSATSLAIGTGIKALTVQAGKAFVAGQYVMLAYGPDVMSWMNGQITAYDGASGNMTVSVNATAGNGTFANWIVALSLPQIGIPSSGGAYTGPVQFGALVTLAAKLLLDYDYPEIEFYPGGARLRIDAANRKGSLAIFSNSSQYERLMIDPGGQVNILGARNLTGNAQGSGNLRVMATSAGGIAYSSYDTQNYRAFQFVRDVSGTAQQVGTISCSESSTSYNTSSDYRLKENIAPLADALDRLEMLPVHRFSFKADPAGRIVDGFIAHEAAAAVPEAVTGEKDGMEAIGTAISPDEEDFLIEDITEAEAPEGWSWTRTGDRAVYQGIDQSKIVPLLTAAVKDLHALTRALTERVAVLEASASTMSFTPNP